LASSLDYNAATLAVPRSNMPGIRLWFQWPAGAIVKVQAGANMAEPGLNPALSDF
jgi:hypothetical protein